MVPGDAEIRLSKWVAIFAAGPEADLVEVGDLAVIVGVAGGFDCVIEDHHFVWLKQGQLGAVIR